MSVAPSYQLLEKIGNPFEENGKEYIFVRLKSGAEKKVRWYEEPMKKIRSTKEVLGFSKGYITIFKGNTEDFTDWFSASSARYHKLFGWYFVSEDELPQIPAGLTPIQLFWEDIANAVADTLKPDAEIRNHIDTLIYDSSSSKWQGEVDERIDRELTVTLILDLPATYYGSSTFYLFVDPSGNVYSWTTSSKKLELGSTYQIRGTIKELKLYKGEQQTVLTRCKVS